jgi:phospholipase/carboxylesterase
LIEREQEFGISPERIILAGFSQGSALALHTAHRFNRPLLGVVALSGYVVEEDTFGVQGHVANSQTPFFLAHGINDMVVPLTRGRRAKELVSEHHSNTTWKTYGMGHEVCMPEIHAIRDWLQSLIRR